MSERRNEVEKLVEEASRCWSWNGAPLIGTFDEKRAEAVVEKILQMMVLESFASIEREQKLRCQLDESNAARDVQKDMLERANRAIADLKKDRDSLAFSVEVAAKKLEAARGAASEEHGARRSTLAGDLEWSQAYEAVLELQVRRGERENEIFKLNKVAKADRARIAEANEEVEKLRVQLAGCGVAAHGGTSPGQIVLKGEYGWSPTYDAVLSLRRRFDDLEQRLPKSAEARGEVEASPSQKQKDALVVGWALEILQKLQKEVGK